MVASCQLQEGKPTYSCCLLETSMTIKSAYKNELDARKKFLIAAEQTDALRADVAKKVWEDAQADLTAARHPPEPLKTGLGGEIIPQTSAGMPGLESALKTPDLLNAEATIERANYHHHERNSKQGYGIKRHRATEEEQAG
jgi:hypothetical protein